MIKRPSSTRARSWISASLLGVAAAAALGLTLFTSSPTFAQDAAAVAPTVAEAVAAAPDAVAAAPVEEAAPAFPELATSVPDKGDTTWMLFSTAAVLLMTIPGLALFYGGLVRAKNIVSMLTQVTVVVSIGIVIWALWGYSMAFTDGGGMNAYVGGFSKVFLNTVTTSTVAESFSVGVVIPELAFVMFQMTFAAITAALVLGGVAERMKMIGVVLFAIIWPTLVYYPIAHMVWWWAGPIGAAQQDAAATVAGAGLIWQQGALDFAGGTVVHINSGIAALMGALICGKRVGYGKESMAPHSLPLTLAGSGLLWFGWFGFNAGSNLESNAYAALAMFNTFLAPAAAALSWVAAEWIFKRKPTLLGAASGLVAGLVVVTPMAGFAGPMGALISGLVVSPICLLFCSAVKSALKYDDSLDVFGIHCIGGITGAILTGLVVNPAWGGAGVVDYTTCNAATLVCDVAAYDMVTQVTAQLKAVVITLLWSGVLSAIIFFVLKLIGALRSSDEAQVEGLDISDHGERAYHN